MLLPLDGNSLGKKKVIDSIFVFVHERKGGKHKLQISGKKGKKGEKKAVGKPS